MNQITKTRFHLGLLDIKETLKIISLIKTKVSESDGCVHNTYFVA